ncbi:hypothetical protein PoB_000737800 [Plakobranchus ocellatus]|uniref:Uncharacterized protein n=1 Tax=Plakobranchus ocellatus TaxID=259542 RepID=A0AAV3YFF6_9GAST|nr:hypothetical protein PoB_000737800 [Plakobranchus ocellatus]
MDRRFPLSGIEFQIATISCGTVTKLEHLDTKFVGLVWVVDSELEGKKTLLKLAFNRSIKGQILKMGSWLGWSRGGCSSLLVRCKKDRRRLNLS